jgi:hypothetical protein
MQHGSNALGLITAKLPVLAVLRYTDPLPAVAETPVADVGNANPAASVPTSPPVDCTMTLLTPLNELNELVNDAAEINPNVGVAPVKVNVPFVSDIPALFPAALASRKIPLAEIDAPAFANCIVFAAAPGAFVSTRAYVPPALAVFAPAIVTAAESLMNTDPFAAAPVMFGVFRSTSAPHVPIPAVPDADRLIEDVPDPSAVSVPEVSTIFPPVPPFAINDSVPPAPDTVTVSLTAIDPLPVSVRLYDDAAAL